MRRIRLIFSRNHDDNTKAYRIYRSTKSPVTRKDTLVMEVAHPQVPKPVRITGDVLAMETSYAYRARFPRLMPNSEAYPIVAYVNGLDVRQLGITFEVDEDGLFLFSTSFSESDVITADYYLDALSVLDTDEVEQEGVTYYGPPARDLLEAAPPENVYLQAYADSLAVQLSWESSTKGGQPYHYRVEAVDKYGNFSFLSPEVTIVLNETDDEQYIIERSVDGINWEAVARQYTRTYIEYVADTNPPDVPKNLQAQVVLKHGTGKADVHLAWEAADEGPPSASPQYRVRAVSSQEVVSEPSLVVGPIYLASPINGYVIRRKVYDGSFPSFAGSDAITVGHTDAQTVQVVDTDVDDNTVYAYAVFAVDKANNPSMAATILVDVGDATSPPPVSGTKVATYSYGF